MAAVVMEAFADFAWLAVAAVLIAGWRAAR